MNDIKDLYCPLCGNKMNYYKKYWICLPCNVVILRTELKKMHFPEFTFGALK